MNRLSILLSLFLVACGGGGSPTQPPTPTQPNIYNNAITPFIASAPPYNTQYYDMPYNDQIFLDINQDGLTDILMVPSHYNSLRNSYDINGISWPMLKIKYFQNNGDGTFSDKTDLTFIGNKFYGGGSGKYVYTDLDADGLIDIMILDSGYETRGTIFNVLLDTSNQNLGFQDNLSVLSYWKRQPNNTFTRVFIDNDMYAAFHHQFTAGDTNGNGKKEIYSSTFGFTVNLTRETLSKYESIPTGNDTLIAGKYTTHPLANISNLTGKIVPIESYEYDGSKFTFNNSILPNQMTRGISGVPIVSQLQSSTVHAVDLDNDGFDDLIMGNSFRPFYNYRTGPTGSNLIYFGSRNGLEPSSQIDLSIPQEFIDLTNNSQVYVSKVIAGDIDNNGLKDIIITYITYIQDGPNMGASTTKVQIFKQVKPRVFVDATVSSWGNYSVLMATQYNPSNLPDYLADINGDGCLDIVVEMKDIYLSNDAPIGYMKNDCKGSFTPVKLKGLVESDYQPNTALTSKGWHPKFTFGWGKFLNSKEYDLIAIKNEISGDITTNNSYVNGYIVKQAKALGI